MIYLLLLAYIFYLVLSYDILEHKQNKFLHYAIVLTAMILISGLRYRLGRDTPLYMDGFAVYPPLSMLKWSHFSDIDHEPLWILVNSFAKSVGDFAVVQLIAAALHIGMWGYALKKIFPSMVFTSLFIYYIFDYVSFNMMLMREGIALGFFLMMLIALSERRKKMVVLWALLASISHIFTLPMIVAFFVYYKFLANRPKLGLAIMLGLAGVLFVLRDFLSTVLLLVFSGSAGDSGLANDIVYYSSDEWYSENQRSVRNMILQVAKIAYYLALLLFVTKPVYNRYINIDRRIFSTMIWLGVMFIMCSFSMSIFWRPYNYCIFFTTMLTVLFMRQIADRVKSEMRPVVHLGLLMLLFLVSVRSMMLPDPLNNDEHVYSNYYPYSSVFDKTLDKHRENIFKDRY